ncbi:hypothetical protein PAXRUDRAFT_821509 [Paxillus rubicundulus Ve08.2h10]|uniref:Uncharacterized protein n=1 Tax=Paxillus rubicundulus Ve08.2h10 TaxID=930991 RepID=A0A0D0DNR1_9AGAM|nr:hypothetical protein PAXRUDRAFT_821509 [Paxillus rubicundulus Ve08.2h10]
MTCPRPRIYSMFSTISIKVIRLFRDYLGTPPSPISIGTAGFMYRDGGVPRSVSLVHFIRPQVTARFTHTYLHQVRRAR